MTRKHNNKGCPSALLLAKPPAASHTQQQQVPAVAAATTTVASSITSASRLSLHSFSLKQISATIQLVVLDLPG
jgi:hypothetical protein